MLKKIFRILVCIFTVGWLIKEIIIPSTVGILYYNKYQELVYACDTAMDDSWYLKDDAISLTEKIHLLDCHEYDKTRKIMLMSGLPQEYLSYLGLKALELYQRPAEEFVEHHRFKER